MSRSGYSDDCDDILALGRWRGRVAQATRGKRGQQLLRDLATAMPEKRLAANKLTSDDGCHCALGAVAALRGIDTSPIEFPDDPDDIDSWEAKKLAEGVAVALNIAAPLAMEIMEINDEDFRPFYNSPRESAEHRWQRVRQWVDSQLIPAPAREGRANG